MVERELQVVQGQPSVLDWPARPPVLSEVTIFEELEDAIGQMGRQAQRT